VLNGPAQTFPANASVEDEPAPKLLLADDDDSVRVTLAAVLAKEGYNVCAVPDGTSALVQIRQDHFDIVVSDLQLGDVEGLAVLAEARQREPDVVTVVLTGYASMESAIDAIRQGVFGYIVKPCKIDEMKDTIRVGLERQRANQVNKQAELAQAAAEARQRLYGEFEAQKGNWLAAISHDLKGPLTTIKGTVQWLQRRGKFRDEARLMAAFETIDLTSARMARMLDELGDLGRAEGDRRPLSLELEDLTQLVRRIVAEQRPTTDRHTIEIDCRCDGLTVLCDGPQMERVVGNLLSNAIKYSPGGIIVVSLDRDTNGQDAMAVLQVTDHGLGIPPDELPHIFDRFYRGTNVSSRIPGTGIGLTGTRQILEEHGATISVASEEGKGSAFTVRVPLAEPESATPADSVAIV